MHINKQSVFIGTLLLAFLTLFFIVLSVRYARGQESNSLSLTPTLPVSPSTPTAPLINPETLAHPEAFKLDQQIKQATRELFNMLTSDSQPPVIENQAIKRKNLMKQAIKKYPYVFLGNALTSSQISSFDKQVQSYFEKSLTLSNAELGVQHIDDFKNPTNSRFKYSLYNLQERKQFNFYPTGEFGGYISGTSLNINGVALDNEIAARVMAAPQAGGGENNNDPVPTNVEILQEASPDALGPQKVTLILLKEKQVQNPYYSKEQIQEMIFKGEVQKFIKEASYGKTWLDEEKSKVYGWYEADSFEDPRHIDVLTVIKLVDPDVDFTQFDRVMAGISRFDAPTSVNTGFGQGDVGKTMYQTADGAVPLTFSAFSIDSKSHVTFAHELGHNFGVKHANWLDCRESTIQRAKNDPDSYFIDGCLHVEYGNGLDVMGSGLLNHFNGYFKEVFRWLSEADKSIVSIRQPGIYNLKLKPLEFNTAIVAKIVNQNASNFYPLYIEYRAYPKGDPDSDMWTGHAGLMINRIYNPLRSYLLWPDLSQDYPLVNFLPQGKPFIDEKGGVTITNLGINQINQEAEIKVELKNPTGCTTHSFNTEIYGIYAHALNSEGTYVPENLICSNANCVLKRKQQKDIWFSFSLKVTNNSVNVCPDVKIRTFIDNSPWGKDLQREVVGYLPSGNKHDSNAAIMIPAYARSGTYNISLKVENAEDKSTYFSKDHNLTIIDDFPFLEGDLNQDNKVDIFDLVLVARDFGKKEAGLPADLDKDGDVDIFDLVLVARNFGKKLSQ